VNTNDLITFEELISALENDRTNNNFKSAVDSLVEAITDWPTKDLREPIEIISDLKYQINDKLTFENLENYLKTLKPEEDSWKIEALTSLLELFDFDRKNIFDKTIELETIIDRITKYYRNKI